MDENLKFIEESEVNIYWPAKTNRCERLVKLSEEERKNYIKVNVGKETFFSDVLLNVESNREDGEEEEISLNIRDIIEANRFKYDGEEKFVLGDITMIDGEGNQIILEKSQCIGLADHIFYMPKDIYLAIDLSNGRIFFKNAPKTSEIHVKYLSLFMILESDYEKLEKAKDRKTLTDSEKETLNNKVIDGYEKLTDTQKNDVKNILDKILYNNENSKLEEFKEKANKEEGPARIKVPLKDDGEVDLDLFTDEICPEFAEREIDMSTIEFETNKIVPFISENDIRNLGMIGFAPKDTKNLIGNIRDTIINSEEELKEIKNLMDGHKEYYDKSLSTCLSLISNGTYNSTEYNMTVKNNYTSIAMMQDYEYMYEKKKEIFESAQKTLASFQYISRKTINKAIENGEFTNKHTFASLAMFFKTMLDCGCVSDMNDNHGVYVAYLKYINKKFHELDGYNYFNEVFINNFDPGKTNNIYSISKELMQRFIRINDLNGLNKQETVDRIILRVQERLEYMYELAYYPVNLATRAYTEILDIFSFSLDKENDPYYKKHLEYIEKVKERGWPINEMPCIEDEDKRPIIESVKAFRDKLDNPEIMEALNGFLKMMWFTVLTKHVAGTLNKSFKNNSDIFKFAIKSSLLFRMIKNIEIITTKEIKDQNEKKENVVIETLDEEALKAFTGKFLMELASFSLFAGISLRLNDLIVDKTMETEKLNESDSQSFFSVILNGLIIPIEVIENAIEKNNEEENGKEIDGVISEEKRKYLGAESTKIFYNGLKGIYDKDGVKTSRLLMGRREVLKESVIFTRNVLDVVNDFLDEIAPEKE